MLCKIGVICMFIGVFALVIGAVVMLASCNMPLVTRDDGKQAKGVLGIAGRIVAAGFVSMIVGAIMLAL